MDVQHGGLWILWPSTVSDGRDGPDGCSRASGLMATRAGWYGLALGATGSGSGGAVEKGWGAIMQMTKRPWAYVCSPYAARPGETVAQHVLWAQQMARLVYRDGFWPVVARLVYRDGFWPVVPHLYAPQFLDDGVPAERAEGLAWGLRLLGLCERVYAFAPDGVPSHGMQGELVRAQALGLPVLWADMETLKAAGLDASTGDRTTEAMKEGETHV